MASPSTTVLINGTTEEVPTSVATSIYDDEGLNEDNATRRHYLENLALPSVQGGQDYPSAASFNESLDQLEPETRHDGLHPPTDQRLREAQNREFDPAQEDCWRFRANALSADASRFSHLFHASTKHTPTVFSAHQPTTAPSPQPSPSDTPPPLAPASSRPSAAVEPEPEAQSAEYSAADQGRG
ncbi:MAG: hypothetical protein Q9219_005136 [cf. Caloplaca sp. 3 TL-2023]